MNPRIVLFFLFIWKFDAPWRFQLMQCRRGSRENCEWFGVKSWQSCLCLQYVTLQGPIWCNHLFVVLMFVCTQRSVAKDYSNRHPFGHASDGCRKGRTSERRKEGTEERRNEWEEWRKGRVKENGCKPLSWRFYVGCVCSHDGFMLVLLLCCGVVIALISLRSGVFLLEVVVFALSSWTAHLALTMTLGRWSVLIFAFFMWVVVESCRIVSRVVSVNIGNNTLSVEVWKVAGVRALCKRLIIWGVYAQMPS